MELGKMSHKEDRILIVKRVPGIYRLIQCPVVAIHHRKKNSSPHNLQMELGKMSHKEDRILIVKRVQGIYVICAITKGRIQLYRRLAVE
jgi:hypothetical protein